MLYVCNRCGHKCNTRHIAEEHRKRFDHGYSAVPMTKWSWKEYFAQERIDAVCNETPEFARGPKASEY
jgi:hypothetical protein